MIFFLPRMFDRREVASWIGSSAEYRAERAGISAGFCQAAEGMAFFAPAGVDSDDCTLSGIDGNSSAFG